MLQQMVLCPTLSKEQKRNRNDTEMLFLGDLSAQDRHLIKKKNHILLKNNWALRNECGMIYNTKT